jgi:hypothetical protein
MSRMVDVAWARFRSQPGRSTVSGRAGAINSASMKVVSKVRLTKAKKATAKR